MHESYSNDTTSITAAMKRRTGEGCQTSAKHAKATPKSSAPAFATNAYKDAQAIANAALAKINQPEADARADVTGKKTMQEKRGNGL